MNRLFVLLFVLFFNAFIVINCNFDKPFGSPPPPASTWIALSDSIESLLMDSERQKIRTVERWERQRRMMKQRWEEILGIGPEIIPSPHADTLEIVQEANYTRFRLRFLTEVGSKAEAFLLVPVGRGPFPGVVCFHSTSNNTIDQPAGLADQEDKHFGKYLAENGFVALMPKNFIFDYRTEEPVGDEEIKVIQKEYPKILKRNRFIENTIRLLSRYPGWTGLGKMIWDGSRCIDFLQLLSVVQKEKIGVIGHSLGGKEAFFQAAFDSRVKAAVSIEGGIGLTFTNWFDPWYIGNQRSRMRGMESHQVLSFIAPRPFLLIAGEGSDGDRSYAFLHHAESVYSLYQESEHLAWFNHKQGHKVTMEGLKLAVKWLERFLK